MRFITVSLLSLLFFGQNHAQRMANDFQLEYQFDAGMFPFREELNLTKTEGSYKAFKQGTYYKSTLDKKMIRKLYHEIRKAGFFKLAIDPSLKRPNRPSPKDKGKKFIKVQNATKRYLLDIDLVKKVDSKTADEVFNILKEYSARLRANID